MNKKIKMLRKKSYNPFKMWGSYAGLIVAILLIIMALNIESYTDNTPCIKKCPYNVETLALDMSCVNLCREPNLFDYTAKIIFTIFFPFIIFLCSLGYLVILVIGFLTGWGVNSLFRKLRGKNEK